MHAIAFKRFIFAAGLLAAGTAASAAALYFTDAGGPLTWDDGTTLNWADAAGGNPPGTYGLAWTGGSDAHFEGAPGIVDIGAGGIGSVNSITFDVDGYTLGGTGAGNTVTLTGPGGNITTGAGVDTISAVLGGTVGLTKLGTGTLVIANASTYTGVTAINAGTLQVGTGLTGAASGSLANTSQITIAADATLMYFRSDANLALPWAKLDGAGTFYYKGTSTTTNYTPINSYSTGNGGATAVPSTFTGTIVVENARINPNATDAYGGTSKIVIKPGGGILVSVPGTFAPIPITIEGQGWSEPAGTPPTLATGGAMRFLSGAIWSGNITLAGDARITPTNNSTGTITGNIDSGGYELEVGYGGSLNGGTLTLAPNTANVLAQLRVSPLGTVAAGNVNAFGAGGVGCPVVMNGGNLNLNGFNLSFANLTNTGLYGTVQNGGAVPATITIGADGGDNEYAVTLADGGPAALTVKKTGTGTSTLSGGNTYSGDTIVENGILKVADGAIPYDVGKGNVVLNGGATAGILDLNGANPNINALVGVSGAILGKVVNNGAGVSTLQLGNGDASGTFAGVIADNANAGTGKIALYKAGANGTGVQILAGANTYTGTTTVANGKLLVDGSLAAGSAVAVQYGATLGGTGVINGDTTVSSGGNLEAGQASGTTLTFAGNLKLGEYASDAVAINLGPAANYPASGAAAIAVTAPGGLIANPDGTGANAISFNIGGATLATGNYKLLSYSGALGGTGFAAFKLGSYPSVGVRGIATLANNPGSIDLSVTVGSIKWTGSANDKWTTNVIANPKNWTFGGSGTDFLAGDLAIFDDSATGTTVDIADADVAPGSITIGGTKNFTFTGTYAITGGTDLTMNGAGTLALNNASFVGNTYTGNTVISQGTVKLGSSLALPGGFGKGSLAVNGVLDLNGNSATVNSPSGTGTITSGAAGSVTFTASDNGNVPAPNSTFSGVIQDGSGTVAFDKSGLGTLTLANVGTYSGATSVTSGTLKIGVANALPHGLLKGNLALAGTLDLNALSATVNGLTGAGIVTNSNNAATATLIAGDNDASTAFAGGIQNGAGVTGLQKIGAGTLVLSNTSLTYSGPTTVTGGTLQIGAGESGAVNVPNTSALNVNAGATLMIYKTTANLALPFAKLSGSGKFYYKGNNSSATPLGARSSSSGGTAAFTGEIELDGARLQPANGTPYGNASRIIINHNSGILTVTAGPFPYPLTMKGVGWWDSATVAYGALRFATLSGNWAGDITLADDSRIGATGAAIVGTISGRITGGKALEIGTEASSAANGTIVLSPSSENLFSKLTVSRYSTLTAGNANAFPATSPAALTINGGTLKLNGNGFAFANLESTALNGAIGNYHAAAASTLTVGSDGSSTTYAGNLINGGAAALALTKVGGGTLKLSGSLTYTGNTAIDGGTLQINSPTATLTTITGSGALAIGAGSALTAASIHVGSLSLGVPAATAVPEPGTIALLIVAALTAIALRKRWFS